jgi:hypothetical protein
MDSGFRRNDVKTGFLTFYSSVKKTNPKKTPVSRFNLCVAAAAGARGNSPAFA